MIEIREERDTQIFVEQYEKVYKELYEKALNMTGNVVHAENLVNDTVLDAYSTFEQLQDLGDFKQWIFTILSQQPQEPVKKKEMRKLRRELERRKEPEFATFRKTGPGDRVIGKVLAYIIIGLAAAVIFSIVTFAYLLK